MDIKAYILIGLGEALMLSLLGLLAALLYVRSLKKILERYKAQKKAGEPSQPPVSADIPKPQVEASITYTKYIDRQIDELRRYHKALNGGQDIALDIDPNVLGERRMAGLRHAMLVAEREATLKQPTDWGVLIARYEQLMRFYEDYPSPRVQLEVEELRQSLQATQLKVAELETFKARYFDAEKSWHSSKSKAEGCLDQIRAGIEAESDGEALNHLVNDYHNSFKGLELLFESGQSFPETLELASKEIDALRRMAGEQSRLIEQLRHKIESAGDDNTKVTLIKGLEKQLSQQQRMVQESETCIQLIEGELNSTYKELQALKAQIKDLPVLRAKVNELTEELDIKDLMIGHLKDYKKSDQNLVSATKDKGNEKLGAQSLSKIINEDDVQALKAELAGLQKRYDDLENLYLDVKN